MCPLTREANSSWKVVISCPLHVEISALIAGKATCMVDTMCFFNNLKRSFSAACSILADRI